MSLKYEILDPIKVIRPVPGFEFCLLKTSVELRSLVMVVIDEFVLLEPVLGPLRLK